MVIETWTQWQQEVVAVIRTEFATVLDDIEHDEIDWEAWRHYYESGRAPSDAVRHAFANL